MIDPDDVALLLVDLQQDILPLSRTNDPATVVKSAAALARLATSLGVPVVASDVPFGPGEPGPVPAIRSACPDLRVIARAGPQVFAHEQTSHALKALGRPVLAIAGVATEIAVLHAATGARSQGYDVHVLVDASGGLGARTEQAAWGQITAVGGVISSVLSFATAMATSFEGGRGAAVKTMLTELLSG